MSDKKFPLSPLAGIDNASARDDALIVGGKEPRVFLRDVVNATIAQGRASMRPGIRNVSARALRGLWQSPLHGDVFAAEGMQWVRVSTADWSCQALADIGPGDVHHLVLNGQVLVAGDAGIFCYNGVAAQRFTLDSPAAPMVVAGAGSLKPGGYGVAVAWLRGTAESPLSGMASCTVPEGGALLVTLPLCLDASVTGVRLYLTRQNGGELLRAGDYPAGTATIELPLLPQLGAPPQFHRMEPMPSGDHLALWRGRLLTARANVLRFSEAMAYHVHDPRHGFVQMPQRITFVAPVDGGIFVGQVNHVAFLRGAAPNEMSLERLASAAPVPGSAAVLPSEEVGEASQGGKAVVVWLAGNGFVLGTPDGGIIETRAGRLKGIAGARGTSVVFGRRVATAVT